MVQDCTEQYAFATSDDKLRVLLAGQPQNFALILTISEVPPVASPFTSRERSPSDDGFVCSLSTPKDFLNCVLPVHS